MGKLLGFLKGPISETLASVDGILGKFITDPEEKLKAQLELARIETEFQEKVMAADVEWAKTQASVIEAETTSQSWMARNWRPILMLVFTFIIAFNYILAPIFSLKVLPPPDQLWELLKIGMGGYIMGRSAEKIVPDIVKALKK